MGKVYKLGNSYFNIEKLTKVSEIKIEDAKALKEYSDMYASINNHPSSITNYTDDCMSIEIQIDDKPYTETNYMFEKSGFTGEVKPKLQEKFEQFKAEAYALLEGFKKL